MCHIFTYCIRFKQFTIDSFHNNTIIIVLNAVLVVLIHLKKNNNLIKCVDSHIIDIINDIYLTVEAHEKNYTEHLQKKTL